MNANEMPALKKLLSGAGLLENGWDGLEPDDANDAGNQYEAALARYEAAREIAVPYMSEQGKRALAKLKEITVMQPSFSVDARTYDEACAYGFAREGQNSVVRHVEACIEIATQGPPVAPGADAPTSKRKTKPRPMPTSR